MKIYLIPGLGYDCRIFEKLDFKNHNVEYLQWIEPMVNEAIYDYAQRMCSSILEEKDNVVIVGYSLGGIVAQEIARRKKIEKIILISSLKSREELPFQFKVIAPLKIHKLFTKELCVRTVRFWGKSHGFETKELRDLLKKMVGRQSNKYLQWALKSLSTWNPPKETIQPPIFQIHGTDDKTLPIKSIKNPNVIIENGSHIMIYKRHKELNEIIMKEINSIT